MFRFDRAEPWELDLSFDDPREELLDDLEFKLEQPEKYNALKEELRKKKNKDRY